MFQKDYLLRIIEEFVHALLRVKNLHQQGKTEQACEDIQSSVTSLAGMGVDEILKVPASIVLTMMESQKASLLAQFLLVYGKMQSSIEIRRTVYRKTFDLLDSLRHGRVRCEVGAERVRFRGLFPKV